MPSTDKPGPDSMRIDKYLWAVRIYKTRSLATDACKSGRVKADGQVVKASREVHPGMEVSVHLGIYTKTIKITALLPSRVSAALVPNFMEDLTPAGEYEKLHVQKDMKTEYRPRGIGRPTKRQRRMIDRLKNFKDFSQES